MAEHFAKANELFIEELYDEAATEYDQAIRVNGEKASYYAARAHNHLKLKRYLDVIPDCTACLKLHPAHKTAHLRMGIARFYLDEFEAALEDFQMAKQQGNKQTALWIRKCEAELRQQKGKEKRRKKGAETHAPEKAAVDDAGKTAESKAKQASAPTTSQATPAGAAVEQKPPPTIRVDWFQTSVAVTITIFAKGVTEEKANVEYGDNTVHALLQLPSGGTFDRTWRLYEAVSSDQTKVRVTPFKIEITMKKKVPEEWASLEAKGPKSVAARRTNLVGQAGKPKEASAYASNKDWDAINQQLKKDEEAEKPEGNDALHALFKTIYAGGNEETKRAMTKSFQTSGGTVLSTNWGEVEKKDYEAEGITAPNGQEVRKW